MWWQLVWAVLLQHYHTKKRQMHIFSIFDNTMRIWPTHAKQYYTTALHGERGRGREREREGERGWERERERVREGGWNAEQVCCQSHRPEGPGHCSGGLSVGREKATWAALCVYVSSMFYAFGSFVMISVRMEDGMPASRVLERVGLERGARPAGSVLGGITPVWAQLHAAMFMGVHRG